VPTQFDVDADDIHVQLGVADFLVPQRAAGSRADGPSQEGEASSSSMAKKGQAKVHKLGRCQIMRRDEWLDRVEAPEQRRMQDEAADPVRLEQEAVAEGNVIHKQHFVAMLNQCPTVSNDRLRRLAEVTRCESFLSRSNPAKCVLRTKCLINARSRIGPSTGLVRCCCCGSRALASGGVAEARSAFVVVSGVRLMSGTRMHAPSEVAEFFLASKIEVGAVSPPPCSRPKSLQAQAGGVEATRTQSSRWGGTAYSRQQAAAVGAATAEAVAELRKQGFSVSA
jgi:hypothetical protein